MMDPIIKAQWVEALRSGKYLQGAGYLEAKGRNCCLGVLARVLNIPSFDSILCARFEFNLGEYSVSFFTSHEKYGLDVNQNRALMLMNDRKNKSFDEIADYIEKATDI